MRPEEARGWLEIQAELQSFSKHPLFRGQALVQAYALSPKVELELIPVASTFLLGPTPNFTSVGDTILLVAEARFATGQTIVGAPILWESSNPQVADILNGDLLVSRGNGSTTLTASSLGLSAARSAVVRQIPTVFTGMGPADTVVTVGAQFQMRPFGLDGNGFPLLPGARVQWTGTVVSVDSFGVVTTTGAGPGSVRGASGATSHTIQVTVVP
jgi:hypothetical protein